MSIVHPAVDSKLSDSILCQRHKVFWEDKKEKTLNYIKRPGSVIKEKRDRSRNGCRLARMVDRGIQDRGPGLPCIYLPMQRATLPMAHYSLDSMQKKNFQRCDKFAADPVIIFVITGERFPRCPPKAASALNFNHGRKKLWSERRGGGLVITSANISSIFTKLISSDLQMHDRVDASWPREPNHPSYQINARGDSSHTHLSIITMHNVYFVQYIFCATKQAQTYLS